MMTVPENEQKEVTPQPAVSPHTPQSTDSRPVLRRSAAAPPPVRKLKAGVRNTVTGKDVAHAAKNVAHAATSVAVGTAKVAGEIAGEIALDLAERFFPFLGTVWFSFGRKWIGLLHLLICCVIVPVGVFMSPLGGNAPLADFLKFVAAVVGAWVLGFVLTLIAYIVGDAKNWKEMLKNVLIAGLIAGAMIIYEVFF